MKKCLEVIVYRVPIAVLSLLCLFISIASLLIYGNQDEDSIGIPAVVFVLPCVILFIIFLLYLYDKSKKISNYGKSLIITLFVILSVQIVLLIVMPRIYPITDCYTTLDEAAAMSDQNGLLDNTTDYFARYPNNYLFTIIMYYLFNLSRAFGVDYFIFACIINVILIDLTIFLGYKVVCDMIDEKRANLYLWIMALCPTNYVFIFFPYTNTFSMPFIMGIILCGIRKEFKYKVGFVTLGILGVCLRPTTVFAVIGVIIYKVLTYKNVRVSKTGIIRGCALIILAVVLMLSEKSFVNMHLTDPNNDKGFPVTHWIMVGLKGTGEVTGSDVRYTQSYKTKSEKIRANIKEINKRTNNLGIIGLGKLLLTKTVKIWAIGTDDFQNYYNSVKQYTSVYNLIFGNNNAWLILYSQIFRAASFLLITVMLFFSFRMRHVDKRIVPIIALFGIVIFLMIWETNKKHSICYTPILTMMMLYGIDIVGKIKWYHVRKESSGVKVGQIKTAMIVFGSVVTLGGAVASFTNCGQHIEEKVLFRSEYNMGFLPCKDNRICQTINPEDSFNFVNIHLRKKHRLRTGSDGKICIKLTRDNSLIAEKYIDILNIKNNWIGLDGFECDPGEYTVEILPIGNCDGITIAYYPGKKLEQYYNSLLLCNGDVMNESSLSVRAYRKDLYGG